MSTLGRNGGMKTGGRKAGTPNKATLLMEERRRIFEEEASQVWRETIAKLPPTYVADQFMGKAPDKVEHSGEINTKSELTQELIAIAKEELKKRMKKTDEK